MKKLFTLAIALSVTISVAQAQTKLLKINKTDGSTYEIETDRIKNMTFGDSPWVSLGMCQYTEEILADFFYIDEEYDMIITYEVEIQENMDQPGLYRLVNPYGVAYPYNYPGDYDDTQDYYIEINACDPDGVYLNLQDTGCAWQYGEFWIYSYAGYMLNYFHYPFERVKETGWCGTLKDGVITFPNNGLFLSMPEYDSDYYYYANEKGEFKIVLPESITQAPKQFHNGHLEQQVDKTTLGQKIEPSKLMIKQPKNIE